MTAYEAEAVGTNHDLLVFPPTAVFEIISTLTSKTSCGVLKFTIIVRQ